jgi:hypothetical protein
MFEMLSTSGTAARQAKTKLYLPSINAWIPTAPALYTPELAAPAP